MTNTTIKPIETVYRGYRFRSRLEARWAVFFDTLGVRWEYEQEGYDLGDSGWYLPDFQLSEYGWWVEIKPTRASVGDEDKYEALSTLTGYPVLVIAGNPWPEEYDILVLGRDNSPPFDVDERLRVCNQWAIANDISQFPNLSVVRQFNNGRNCWPLVTHEYLEKYGEPIVFHWPATDNNFGSGNHCHLMKSYNAARSARFEHGENPGNKEPKKVAHDNLLPCPFCGGAPEVRRNPQNPTFESWLECTRCKARTSSDDSYNGAVTEWNRRAEADL